jgi:hypothetical protein
MQTPVGQTGISVCAKPFGVTLISDSTVMAWNLIPSRVPVRSYRHGMPRGAVIRHVYITSNVAR